MNIKLIADAGSTTVEWSLLDHDGNLKASVSSEGVNALLTSHENMRSVFQKVKTDLPTDFEVEEVHYYGAGCATPEICGKVKGCIHDIWPHSISHVNSDLLAAARALLNENKGIACILGTGSNSCLYNGKEIIYQIPSLGYVLGDEGSGAALGKRLLSDAFKEQLPANIREMFLDEYKLTLPEILDRLYRQPSPNRFLASLVPFLSKNLWNPYIYSLVLKELTRFMKRNVAMYNGAHSIDICFTGSVAFHFDKILREAASSVGYRVTKVTKGPMEDQIGRAHV